MGSSLRGVGTGFVMLAAGLALGQPRDVLAKAARVCLECIGVG